MRQDRREPLSAGAGNPGRVLIHDLLGTCLKALERRIEGRGIRIVRQIDRTGPEIDFDRDLLRRIIDTLLAEAAAGTADGGRVRVCLKHNRAAVMLSIKHQGAGMTPEERAALFSDTSRAAPEGAPLTLHACHEAVSKAGGSLFVNSTPGRGSTYYATFPPPRAPAI